MADDEDRKEESRRLDTCSERRGAALSTARVSRPSCQLYHRNELILSEHGIVHISGCVLLRRRMQSLWIQEALPTQLPALGNISCETSMISSIQYWLLHIEFRCRTEAPRAFHIALFIGSCLILFRGFEGADRKVRLTLSSFLKRPPYITAHTLPTVTDVLLGVLSRLYRQRGSFGRRVLWWQGSFGPTLTIKYPFCFGISIMSIKGYRYLLPLYFCFLEDEIKRCFVLRAVASARRFHAV